MTDDPSSPDYPHDQDVDDDPLAGFEDFWALYPTGRHQAKKDAQKAWTQIKAGLDPQLRERILENLRTRTWPREVRYVPLASTFLRGARYDDEPVTADAIPITPANRWMPSAVPEDWCHHEPRCNSRDWHAMKVKVDQEGSV